MALRDTGKGQAGGAFRGEAREERFGTFRVLDLRGTWRDMGRQYGALAADLLRETYERTVAPRIAQADGKERERLDAIARGFHENYPHRLREVLAGMAETSGLDLAQHMLLNAAEGLFADDALGGRSDCAFPMHCSGIAVWGEYSAGALIYGRNYDRFGPPASSMRGEHLVVAVYHPCDGSLATATIGYPGSVYLTTGINERGIFVAVNNGEPSGGALQYHNRVPAVAELLLFLTDSPNLDQLESFLQSTRSNFAYVVGTADDQTSRCFEWPVFDVKRRLSVRRPGLMVATNHFTEPSWGLPRPDDEKFFRTRTRRQNLLNLAEHFKGSIDLARMKKIMDTRIEDLGATTDETEYQVVALPDSMTLSIKVPGLTEWVDIPIGEFM